MYVARLFAAKTWSSVVESVTVHLALPTVLQVVSLLRLRANWGLLGVILSVPFSLHIPYSLIVNWELGVLSVVSPLV